MPSAVSEHPKTNRRDGQQAESPYKRASILARKTQKTLNPAWARRRSFPAGDKCRARRRRRAMGARFLHRGNESIKRLAREDINAALQRG